MAGHLRENGTRLRGRRDRLRDPAVLECVTAGDRPARHDASVDRGFDALHALRIDEDRARWIVRIGNGDVAAIETVSRD